MWAIFSIKIRSPNSNYKTNNKAFQIGSYDKIFLISNFPICHQTEVKIGERIQLQFLQKKLWLLLELVSTNSSSYTDTEILTLVLVPDTDIEFWSHTKSETS